MTQSTRPRRPSVVQEHIAQVAQSGNDIFAKFSDIAITAVSTAGKITQKGVSAAGEIVTSTADAVGLRDKVEAAENMARKLATRGRNDASKAVNKARRMASRAFVFEDEASNYEYDVLLSAAGAVEKHIPVYSSHSPMFTLPAGSAFVYKARVKKHDIGFSVREMLDNSTPPALIENAARYTPDNFIQGYIAPIDRERTINLHFDNSYSTLQGKSIVFWVAMGQNVTLADDQLTGNRSKEAIAAEEGPSD